MRQDCVDARRTARLEVATALLRRRARGESIGELARRIIDRTLRMRHPGPWAPTQRTPDTDDPNPPPRDAPLESDP